MVPDNNAIFGRKVFFIHPPFSVKKNIIPQLCDLEYDIYIIPDYTKAKDILRRYPDSICYINADVDMNLEQWMNFIESFETDADLETIHLGVISERMKKNDREFLESHCTLSAGVFKTSHGANEVIEIFCNIFDMISAKGRRQYVRAKCTQDPTAVINCNAGDKFVPLKIADISSVGMSCFLPQPLIHKFMPNTVLKNSTLSLGSNQILCSVIVYKVKQDSAPPTMILLFPKGVSYELKNTVRLYIFEEHQKQLAALLEMIAPDQTDYSVRNKQNG